MQAQEADGDGHGPRGIRSGRRDNRFGHDVEDDAEGNGDQEGDAHGRRRPFADFIVFLQGETVADGRHQAHGHGCRQDRCQVDERYGHARQVTEQLRGLMGRITGYFQPPRYDEQVQVGYDGEHDARQGNGDSQDDQALEDVLDAFLLECRPVDGEGPLQLIIVIDQDQPGCKPTGAGAETGTAGGIIEAVRQEERGEAEHDDDADQLFNDLGNGCRCHLLPALQIAAVAGNDRRKEDGRCQGDERIIGPAFADDVFIDEEAGTKEHEDTQKKCRRTEHGQGHVENVLGAEIVLFGYFFSCNDGNCNRQPGTGNIECQQVNRESHLIDADAFTAENTGQDDPVDTANGFDDKARQGQDQCAGDKLVCHDNPLTL